MLKKIRQQLISALWHVYQNSTEQIQNIAQALAIQGTSSLFLDHFAIIDLPGPHTGISELKKIFTLLGFMEQGQDYLPCKQNDFLWLTECDSFKESAKNVLPQVVVADFRMDELPIEVKKIVENYAHYAPSSPYSLIKQIIAANNETELKKIPGILAQYFSGRDWPLPTIKHFHTAQEFNELLAWVLVFGRKPNHFTLAIHLLENFNALEEFHSFIIGQCKLSLNTDGGLIKGGPQVGISQSSTKGELQRIKLANGEIEIPLGFVEFVWRYPQVQHTQPYFWSDYFTGFIAHHADHVIESLYTRDF